MSKFYRDRLYFIAKLKYEIFCSFLIYISSNLACIAQSITGKIVDEQGNAIQFANVAMLQSKILYLLKVLLVMKMAVLYLIRLIKMELSR